MRVITGAEELGALNMLDFNLPTPEDPYPAPPKSTVFGAEGRSKYIQKIIFCKLNDNEEYITVARKGGIIQMYDINTLKLYKEWRGASKTPTDAIVGLEFAHNRLYSCSARGRLVIRNLKDNDSEFNYWHSSIKEPISAFCVHSTQEDVIATGGKDKDLEVMQLYNNQAELRGTGESRPHWILQALQADDSPIHQRVRTRWQAKAGPPSRNSHVQSNNACNSGEGNMGRSVQYPVWISGIQFLNLNQARSLGWRIAVTTRYGYINIYETSISRRCVFSVLVSNYPLVNLWFGGNERELIYTDSQYGVGMFDSVSGKLQKMKGEAGSSMIHVHAMYRENSNSNSLNFPEVLETRIGELESTAVDSDFEEEVNNDISDHTTSDATIASTVSTTGTSTLSTYSNINDTTTASPPIMKPLLVSGGLDKYLRVYDLEAANMVLKVRMCDKVSDLWVVDATNSSLKRRRSQQDEELEIPLLERSAELEKEERENKRARIEADVCME